MGGVFLYLIYFLCYDSNLSLLELTDHDIDDYNVFKITPYCFDTAKGSQIFWEPFTFGGSNNEKENNSLY